MSKAVQPLRKTATSVPGLVGGCEFTPAQPPPPAGRALYGWTHDEVYYPEVTVRPRTRIRFFRIWQDGTFEDLGFWGGDQYTGWNCCGLVWHPDDQHWYVLAAYHSTEYSDPVVSRLAVYRCPTLPPAGSPDDPGADVQRMAFLEWDRDLGVALWIWDPIVWADGRVYFLRTYYVRVGSTYELRGGLTSVDASGDVQEHGVPEIPGYGSHPIRSQSITVHNERIYFFQAEDLPDIGFIFSLAYYEPGVGWTLVDTTGLEGVQDIRNARLESAGGRLYLGLGPYDPSTWTYRLDEASRQWVLQGGALSGMMARDWAQTDDGLILAVAGWPGTLVRTPGNRLSDSWELIMQAPEDFIGIGTIGNDVYVLGVDLDAQHVYRVQNPGGTPQVETVATLDDFALYGADAFMGPGAGSRHIATGPQPASGPIDGLTA